MKKKTERSHKTFIVLITLALYSTIAIPAVGNINNRLQFFLDKLKIVRINQLTQFFYTYNIIGVVTMIFVIMLILLILGRNTILLNKNNGLSGKVLIFSMILHTVIQITNYLFYEGVSSSFLILPALLFLIFLYIQTVNIEEIGKMSNRIERTIITAGFLNALMIIIQFFVLSLNGSILNNLRIIRPPGFFPDAVLVSIFLMLSVWIMLNKQDIRQTKKTTYILVLIFAGLLNGSRSFIVLLLLALAMLFYKKLFKRNKKELIILMLLSAVIVFVFIASFLLQGLPESINKYIFDSSRDMKREIAINLFLEKPILGNGTSLYAETERAYGFRGTNPHNYYLQILSESGLVGFIPFIIMIVAAMTIAIKQKDKKYFGILMILIFAATTIGIGNSLPLMTIWFYTYGMIYKKC